LQELKDCFTDDVRNADLAIVGSHVPDGIDVGDWVTSTKKALAAFYDMDTPVTLSKLEHEGCDYLSPELISRYDMYLSFAGGPMLQRIEWDYDAPRALPLYCSVDPDVYHPEKAEKRWNLGYIGTYCDDRQPTLDRLMLEPARRWADGRFIVVGAQYPDNIEWPANVHRIEHLSPSDHRSFYNSQDFTLNVTRADMVQAGYSPSVRLFEAAACGTPIISDRWEGLDQFFRPGKEILLANSPADVLHFVRMTGEDQRNEIAERARKHVLAEHTAAHRAAELEGYVLELLKVC
jgi:spore maturation protein CgeB